MDTRLQRALELYRLQKAADRNPASARGTTEASEALGSSILDSLSTGAGASRRDSSSAPRSVSRNSSDANNSSVKEEVKGKGKGKEKQRADPTDVGSTGSIVAPPRLIADPKQGKEVQFPWIQAVHPGVKFFEYPEDSRFLIVRDSIQAEGSNAVKESTMDNLQQANEILIPTREEFFPAGFGNIVADIANSKGEGYLRRHMARKDGKGDPGGEEPPEVTARVGRLIDTVELARNVMGFRGGNCGESGAITFLKLAQKISDHPIVSLYGEPQEGDLSTAHAAAGIGDPRMREYGRKDTVIVDPYPQFPAPTNLENWRPGLNGAVVTSSYPLTAGAPPLGFAPGREVALEKWVEDLVQDAELGPEYVKKIFQEIVNQDVGHLYNEPLFTTTPGTAYQAEGGKSVAYDLVRRSYIEKVEAKYAVTARILQEIPDTARHLRRGPIAGTDGN